MPRLLALEWDSREARLVSATTHGGAEVVIEDAFSVPLSAAGSEAAAEASAGARIAEAIAAHRLGRAETLMAIGRANLELKQLTLPPAPDDELADLVRFQAQREFTSLGENWPLDFVPLGGDPAEPRNVLAATIDPELVAQIDETCHRAGVKPRRLVLRACAAASLLRRRTEAASDTAVRLLIDLLADEADLTVMVGRQVVFLRTARLPGDVFDTTDACKPLVAEIRRTIGAVHNQLGGRRVEEIYLCAGSNEHAVLLGHIEESLALPTRRFDPFDGVERGAALRSRPPAAAGRFAPLVGMLLDEADGTPHDLDFLNPRRRVEPPSRRNQYMTWAAAAALAPLIIGGGIWYALWRMDNRIERLTDESKTKQTEVDRYALLGRQVAEIDKWTAGDIAWLDELKWLAEELPAANDAMLTDLSLVSHADGGEIVLEGRVRTTATIDALERGLRDERHSVEGLGKQEDTEVKPYVWSFGSAVIVSGQEKP